MDPHVFSIRLLHHVPGQSHQTCDWAGKSSCSTSKWTSLQENSRRGNTNKIKYVTICHHFPCIIPDQQQQCAITGGVPLCTGSHCFFPKLHARPVSL